MSNRSSGAMELTARPSGGPELGAARRLSRRHGAPPGIVWQHDQVRKAEVQPWAHESMDGPYSGQITGVEIYQFFTGVEIWKMKSPERQLVWTPTLTMRSCGSVSAQEFYEELYEEARHG